MLSISKSSSDPTPYINGDIFHESSQGRSLHNNALRFYREVMGLETPITKEDQPSVAEITQSIEDKVEKSNLGMRNNI